MANFISGYGGKAVSGSTDIDIRQWRVRPVVTYEPTTHSGSPAIPTNSAVVARQRIPVEGYLAVEFEGDWDADARPTDDPPNLNAGESIALKLYLGNTGKYWSIPVFKIDDAEITNVVAGKVTWRVSGESDGTWTLPS